MDFTKLNQTALLEGNNKPLIKLSELAKDVPTKILLARLINTKYGECILLELEENTTFLPKRVVPMMKDHLEEFSSGNYSIVFQGFKNVNKPCMGTLFKFM